MKCRKCFLKLLEIVVYLATGYFCGGCSNTGTCVLHANVMNVTDPTKDSVSTNNPTFKE